MTVDVEMIPKAHELFTQHPDERYYVLYGGRGKGATWSIARWLVVQSMAAEKFILCAREIQRSIEYSSKKTIDDTIRMLNLAQYFTITKYETRCNLTGSRFIFHGLSEVTNRSIKGLEALDIVWIAEGQDISENSLKYLTPTVRKAGSYIVIDFNPDDETDPVYQRFIANGDKLSRCRVLFLNWRDNPWFTDELEEERQNDLRSYRPEDYNWIWEGSTRVISDLIVFRDKFVVEQFDIPKTAQFYQGADWGFSVDPSVLVRAYVNEYTLYICDEAYRVGVEIDHLPGLFDQVPEARRWRTIGDSSRPDTISYMRRHGFSIQGSRKGKNSVEEGIEFIRAFHKIVIHPRCKHTIQEFKTYSYQADRLTGEPIPKLEDKNNHCIDALRYALEPLRKPRTIIDLDTRLI